MAAGLGFKTFTTGEVLSAGDVNGYLMQGVLVFATAAARDAAITSPQEGQYVYLKDSNTTAYYSGSAWVSTTVGGSNYTLLSNAAPSTGTYTVTGLSGYDQLYIVMETMGTTAVSGACNLRLNADSGSNYDSYFTQMVAPNTYSANSQTTSATVPNNVIKVGLLSNNTSSTISGYIKISGANTAGKKLVEYAAGGTPAGGINQQTLVGAGVYNSATVISSISLINNAGSWTGGIVKIYGTV